MFTGLISDIGRLITVDRGRDRASFVIACGFDSTGLAVGASVACAGICLTVERRPEAVAGGCRFRVEASAETLFRTTAATWTAGERLNLERALKVGDELGGHWVLGHVDGVATIVERRVEGESLGFTVRPPTALLPLIAEKGSVTLDGISLTVNRTGATTFDIMIVPHTAAHTTFGTLALGTMVNIEVDALARYVARLTEQGCTHGA